MAGLQASLYWYAGLYVRQALVVRTCTLRKKAEHLYHGLPKRAEMQRSKGNSGRHLKAARSGFAAASIFHYVGVDLHADEEENNLREEEARAQIK